MNVKLATLLFCLYPVCEAADSLAGRWEGAARIPARDIPLIIDIAPNGSGTWQGSAISPGFGVKGAPLADLKVTGASVEFTVKGGLGEPAVSARLTADGSLQGDYIQGGNKGPVTLRRSGDAAVELPRQGTAVRKQLEGAWEGEFDYITGRRRIALELTNRGDRPASAGFTIIGKRETAVPVDTVTDEGGIVTLESREFGITLELRLTADGSGLSGLFIQGPFELPVAVHRAAGKAK